MDIDKTFLYQEIHNKKQWCTWRVINGRKVPSVKVNDPLTWRAFEEVQEPRGFVLSMEDPYVVIDLDHCLKEAKPKQYVLTPFTSKVLFEINSYTEVSPSGSGLHIWVKGIIPEAIKKPEIEVYGFLR